MLAADDPVDRWRHADLTNLLGSESYTEAFTTAIHTGLHGQSLVSDRQRDLLARGRALGVGIGATGGFAVPFQLDPTLILQSAGAVDPMRRIARVEMGHAKEFDLVTTQGVVAAYAAEGAEVPDGSPTLAQPKLVPSRAHAFVPFSLELGVTWDAAASELTSLLTDAGGLLDAQAHITGSGTAPIPQGIVTGLVAAGTASLSYVTTATAGVTTLADLQLLQRTVAPRFRPKSQFIANLATIQLAQTFQVVTGQSAVQGSAQSVGGMSETGGPSLTLLGDPLSEASYMDSSPTTTGQHIAVAGDFHSGYCVYDVVPSWVLPVPMLFGPNQRPTAQRGLYLFRYSAAQVVNLAALALLTVK
jgi:HK97 family phage major capsid protein